MTATQPAPSGALPPERLSETLPEFLARGGHREFYDVVIVGSGYGGSMAAHALATASGGQGGQRVLLLERGREFHPGDFPARFGELPRELRLARQETGEVSGHEGLFDIRLGPDVVAMVGNGLGGGSLINAGVMLEPKPDDIAAAPNPTPHRHTLVEHLRALKQAQVFTRAARLLGGQVKRDGRWVHNDVTRLPTAPNKVYALPKAQALHDLAKRQALPTRAMGVTVAWDAGRNFPDQAALNACIQCGDCMTGCNAGAKNSLDRSLLHAAKQHMGARLTIVTGASVGSLARAAARQLRRSRQWVGPLPDPGQQPDPNRPGWRLRLFHTGAELQRREVGQLSRPNGTGVLFIHAQHVVLAAGTLGSPEILLRSRSDELPLSARLGESFSGNGDNIAAVHRLPAAFGDVHGGADERVPPDKRGVGPTTTARITLDKPQGALRPFQVEEFAVPGPVRRLFDELVTTGWALAQLPRGDGSAHAASDIDPLAVDPAAMRQTLLVGLVGHDSADGSLRLARPLRPRDAAPPMGALRIHWPQARRDREFEAAHEALRRLVEHPAQAGAGQPPPTLVANPMWRLLPEGMEELVTQPRGPVLTVHPLGGCRIGPTAAHGVVDALGRVFNAVSGEVFESLVVLDGSVIGSSLGVNPALSIAALTLHAMDHHVQRWGFGTPLGNTETEPGQPAGKGSLCQVPTDGWEPAPDHAPPLPSATEVAVTERLWGPVVLAGPPANPQPQQLVLELTLAFAPQPVSVLVGPVRQPMQLLPQASRLRLYSQGEWDRHLLRAADDNERAEFIVAEASLRGSLRFLHREPSTRWQRIWRGLAAYFGNRGWRDLYQRLFGPLQHDQQRQGLWSLRKDVGNFVRLASHNGQCRRFDYELTLIDLQQPRGAPAVALRAGDVLAGHKRLGYARRASPWTQLTQMTLSRLPGLQPGPAPTLKLDPRFLARQGKPLLHIERQANHADALADLAAFGLYLARVLLHTHLWSFRKPDRSEPREPYRLPGGILGLPEPQVTTLVVDRWRDDKSAPDQPVSIRLTRYPRPAAPASADKKKGAPPPPPLVMLHGYSASGTTFTHASLGPDAAAAWFWRQGRDVWVVDLRTSCGLPSAQRPWAMEQPALVDIPAALLHIRNATGQKVDVLAHCIGGVMLGMALLSNPKWVRSGRLELGTETWLTSEHFGVLSAFNGDGDGRVDLTQTGHPTVRRVILSQKGPVLRYTEANVLRAHVLQYARRWLLPEHFSFQTSRDAGVAEQLLDRFLSSLPYDAADFDVENPGRPCARTEWVATRHRLDALFGRVFTAANLRAQTLEAIDELFGPINLDTVAQTIHFARTDTITNQRGRGEFVTGKRLRERWAGIPTLVLHGADSGMVDPYTHHLLTAQLQAAGVPVHQLPPQPDGNGLFKQTGHQDSLIGTGAPKVFALVEAFLSDQTTELPRPPALESLVCAEPWIGPRLVPEAGGGLQLAAMSRSDQGDCRLWLVPVRRSADPAQVPSFDLLTGPGQDWRSSAALASSGQWHRALPDLGIALPDGVAAADAGWLAVFVYATEETNARPARTREGRPEVPPPPPPPQTLARPVTGPYLKTVASPPAAEPVAPAPGPGMGLLRPLLPGHGFELLHHVRPNRLAMEVLPLAATVAAAQGAADLPQPAGLLPAVQAWLARQSRDSCERCFVSLQAAGQAAQLHRPDQPVAGFSFAVASCQYPSGLFDRLPAAASLAAMASEPIQMALLVGDQIYADASAGLVDPTRSDELFEQPHERALRQAGMRALLRRVPAMMLLDDHELVDNWQPLPQDLPHAARRVRRQRDRLEEVRRDGVAAYMSYQRMSPRGQTSADQIDWNFSAGGHPFYLLDTRSGRERGTPSAGAGGGLIVCQDRLDRLKRWLTKHADKVKFVVTPSMLLPRLAEVAGRPGNACRADAWDGFPDSLGELLRHIAESVPPIRKTVFLSGDAHHSLCTEAWLGQGADRVKVVSVHSSALYAPYPFANGRPQDLAVADDGADLQLTLDSQTQHAALADGYAVLEVVDGARGPVLRVTFAKAQGEGGSCHWVDLV